MTIRKAKKSDAVSIARIHVDTWRVAYAGIIPEGYLSNLSMESHEQRWARVLSKSTNGTLVAVMPDGQVVGWASFGLSRNSDGEGVGELYAIYLDVDYWGKGMGRQLMDNALSHLHGDGFAIVTLWVLQENSRARTFYEKVGFAPDGTSKVIEIDGKILTELRYRKTAQQDV